MKVEFLSLRKTRSQFYTFIRRKVMKKIKILFRFSISILTLAFLSFFTFLQAQNLQIREKFSNLPDLTISEISSDSLNNIIVKIKNIGRTGLMDSDYSKLDSGKPLITIVELFINGVRHTEHLSNIDPNKALKFPKNEVTWNTSKKVWKDFQDMRTEILVNVDAGNCIQEANENNNSLRKVFERALPETPAIEVTAPAHLDIWYQNETYQIKWHSIRPTRVNISLFQENRKVLDIAQNISGENHNWRVPSSIQEGYYKVKVDSVSQSMSGESKLFQIRKQPEVYVSKIEVISPAQNSIWHQGSSYEVKWNAVGVTNRQNVSLWQGSQKIIDIAQNVAGGSYNWIIPLSIVPNSYKIKVECVTPCGGVFGESNFRIEAPLVLPDVALVSCSARIVDNSNKYRVKVLITVTAKNNSSARLSPFISEEGKRYCGSSNEGCVKVRLNSRYPNSANPYNIVHLVEDRAVNLDPPWDQETITFTDYFSWYNGIDNIGEYSIALDGDNWISESNENNNVYTFSVNFGKY